MTARLARSVSLATLTLLTGCASVGAEPRADERLVQLGASVDRWLDDSARWLDAARGNAPPSVVDRLAAARFNLLGVRLTHSDVSDTAKAAAFDRAVLDVTAAQPHTEPSSAPLMPLERELGDAALGIRDAIDAYDVAARDYDATLVDLPAGSLDRLDGTPVAPRVLLSESRE